MTFLDLSKTIASDGEVTYDLSEESAFAWEFDSWAFLAIFADHDSPAPLKPKPYPAFLVIKWKQGN